MTACLRLSGKMPFLNERLTISVIIGAIECTHFLSRTVGIGSRLQCLLGDERIRAVISSFVAAEKFSRQVDKVKFEA